MKELVAFVRARVGEDAQWLWDPAQHWTGCRTSSSAPCTCSGVLRKRLDRLNAEHNLKHQLVERAVAVLEAWHAQPSTSVPTPTETERATAVADLELVAVVYAWHADYQPGWRR